ncbi:predicted protein [Nematostella vectensis]|uniref:TGF-beta family profile domain-containing protein n=1 Tax=Nematostella vectensis TaxID=45351 RepID=A7SZ10_NEMVE|nr:predicted protein [Nematostella vectensis]|eukprot:XP_001623157.1 predicted protein [Nematostella vectensis]
MQAWFRAFSVICFTRIFIQSYKPQNLDSKWEALHRPLLRKRALELTQKHMLNVLGLSEMPRVHRRRVRPHSFMLELYRTLSSKMDRNKARKSRHAFVNTVRGVVDQESLDKSVLELKDQLYVFNTSNIPYSEKLVSAELRLLRIPTNTDNEVVIEHGTAYRAGIYAKNTRSSFYGSAGLEMLDSFVFDITDTDKRWFVMSVTKAVQRLRESRKNVCFLILKVMSLTSGKLIAPVRMGFSKEFRVHDQRALLVLFADDGKMKSEEGTRDGDLGRPIGGQNHVRDYYETQENSPPRTTRAKRSVNRNIPKAVASAIDTSRKRRKKSRRQREKRKCRRKRMYVDFRLLGWSDWIIAPQGYDAYLCEGECKYPIDNYLRPTNHATVQTIVNSLDPSIAPKACCTPNELSPISILYTEDGSNNVVYKNYKDMVVERCGCS